MNWSQPNPIRRSMWMVAFVFPTLVGCVDIPAGSTEKNNLSEMDTASINVADKMTYTCYVARTSQQQMLGLMNTSRDELADDHGMIFAFNGDGYRSFWMRNTIIPLDIAYIRSDGLIVKTYTMEPLNEMGYPSLEPAQYVLEVNAGQLAEHGITEGDIVTIPDDL